MTDWLYYTLVWTAVLIGFVLLVRRPVARWFGPQFAYALWALPMMRLLMPAITLPAWMAPAPDAAPATNEFLLTQSPDTPVATQEGAFGSISGTGAAAADLTTPVTPSSLLEALPLVELGCAVWLIGAAIFLWRRFDSYFQLRDELMERAREIGRSGRVRLVETPGTDAPLAFGVLDPVIALPEGFMAQPDKTARDLALAHELAHHHGRDLLINIIVQPLFAVHWFNPLCHYGWLALRRDQEAACDARVVSHKPAEQLAAYASLIAGTAARPNIATNAALAAPMACPVLGDKSIIHRLRSLKMSDTTPRRRWAGRALMGAAVLALPLTASISYAASDAPHPPEPPAPPSVGVVPPAPPVPPAMDVSSVTAPLPPEPPVPPAAPLAPLGHHSAGADGAHVQVDVSVEEKDGTRNVVVIRNGKRYTGDEAERMLDQIEINIEAHNAAIEKEVEIAEKHAKLAEKHARMAEERIERAVVRHQFAAGQRPIRIETVMECNGDIGTRSESDADGTRVVICPDNIKRDAIMKARDSLKQVRKSIRNDKDLSAKERAEALREIDAAIKEMDSEIG